MWWPKFRGHRNQLVVLLDRVLPLLIIFFFPLLEFETKNRHHHQRSMMSSSRQQQQKDSKSSPGNSSLTTGNGGRTQLMMQPQGKSVVSLFQCLRLILSGLEVRSSLTRVWLEFNKPDLIRQIYTNLLYAHWLSPYQIQLRFLDKYFFIKQLKAYF